MSTRHMEKGPQEPNEPPPREQTRAKCRGSLQRAPSLGVGRVECKRGDYSDAIDKGHGVHLYVLEPSGACDPALTSLLRTISKSVGLPGIQDSTVYGTSRASTRSFYYHHLAATSAAIVQQDALTIVSYAAAESFRLTLSPSPSSAPAGSFGGRRA